MSADRPLYERSIQGNDTSEQEEERERVFEETREQLAKMVFESTNGGAVRIEDTPEYRAITECVLEDEIASMTSTLPQRRGKDAELHQTNRIEAMGKVLAEMRISEHYVRYGEDFLYRGNVKLANVQIMIAERVGIRANSLQGAVYFDVKLLQAEAKKS